MVADEKEYEPMFKKVEIYGLRNCKKCHMIWDRDVNASESMTELSLCYLEKKRRPKYLCKKKLPDKKSRTGIEKSPQYLIPESEGVIQPENVVHGKAKIKLVLSLKK
jgi:hypothetical protein